MINKETGRGWAGEVKEEGYDGLNSPIAMFKK